eukprot:TRINITY_DN21335_c0_g1_i1.p3 TRINITY_DN21335_c0_g1~~TRINITY_DN21335_c0_g1_i1.p3  ORF type:complete len:111 (-),score=1.56 TRINITY_DN21335_c0_g1_i1:16-348(-)
MVLRRGGGPADQTGAEVARGAAVRAAARSRGSCSGALLSAAALIAGFTSTRAAWAALAGAMTCSFDSSNMNWIPRSRMRLMAIRSTRTRGDEVAMRAGTPPSSTTTTSPN